MVGGDTHMTFARSTGLDLRLWKRYEVWSNAFYLAPLMVALNARMAVHGVVIGMVILLGLLYHLSRETRWGWFDNKAAWTLILANIVVIYLGSFAAPYFPIAVLFLMLALYYHYIAKHKQYGGYGLNHGMWHMYGALITLFSLLTFLG